MLRIFVGGRKMSEGVKKTVTVLLTLLAVFLFFKFIFRLLLPFLIAFLFATLFYGPIEMLHKRTGIKKKILGAVVVLISVAFIGFTVFLTVSRLISEIEQFAASVSENAEQYISAFFGFLDTVAAKLPFIEAVGGNLSETVASSVKDMILGWASRLPELIARFIGMLPEILLFTVILIMASYYFCADYRGYTERFSSFLPEKAVSLLSVVKKRLTDTGISYLKACLVLMFITYVELLIGFMMLDVRYAFTLALIVAAVDMLPILGVGTALLPWALWAWFSGDSYTAIGLLVINVTVTVIRRFIEPRIIGSGIGLTPIMTLLSMYVGFRLFGLTGLFFSPLIAILVLLFLPENISSKLGFRDKNTEKTENISKNNNKISKST